MNDFDPTKRVLNGIELLDKEFPNWEEAIDLDKLAIEDCNHCILGQLFGEYIDGLDILRISQHKSCLFGFDTDRFSFKKDDLDLYQYIVLKDCWAEVIKERLTSLLAV